MNRAERERRKRDFIEERREREKQALAARQAIAEQPHRRWLPPDKRLSEKAATPLGGLNLTGVITDEQEEAGRRYQVIVGLYRKSIGIPDDGSKGGGKDWPCMGQPNCDPCKCREIKEAYNSAFGALGDAGHKAQVCVARVAVQEAPCPTGHLKFLIMGLDALVRHFGLVDKR